MGKEHDYLRQYFYGPVFEKPLLVPISKTSITPNQLTVFTIILSLAAAILISINEHQYFFLTAIILVIRNGFDCLDGKLARLKNIQSKLGHQLDMFADKFLEISLAGSILYNLFTYGKIGGDEFFAMIVIFCVGMGIRVMSKHTSASLLSLPTQNQSILKQILFPFNLVTRSILWRTSIIIVGLFCNQLKIAFYGYLLINLLYSFRGSLPYVLWWDNNDDSAKNIHK